MDRDRTLLEYLLRLADSDLILAQRLGEWVGHGAVLEEDIATTNVGLDLRGQSRLWFAYAGEVEARIKGKGRSEDEFAFVRDAGEFRNLMLVEQPNGNYADTMARQFYFDVWHELLLCGLSASSDARVAEIAAKAVKEVHYHGERSTDWVIRLGDGTEESHARMQAAVDDRWMYTGEMFEADAIDIALIDGIETITGGEVAWFGVLLSVQPGVLVAGLNATTTDTVATAVMGYDPRAERGTAPFLDCDNSLRLAEARGVGTTDLKNIEVRGLSIREALFPFGIVKTAG